MMNACKADRGEALAVALAGACVCLTMHALHVKFVEARCAFGPNVSRPIFFFVYGSTTNGGGKSIAGGSTALERSDRAACCWLLAL